MNGKGFAIGQEQNQYYDFAWQFWGKLQMKPDTR